MLLQNTNQKVNSQLYSDLNATKCIKLFVDKFKPKTQRIIYPGCGYNCSPRGAFGENNKNILHVDKNQYLVDLFREYGFYAKDVPIEKFVIRDKFDIGILLDFWCKEILSMIAHEGYILCDNKCHQADRLFIKHSNEYKYLGNIKKNIDEDFIYFKCSEKNIKNFLQLQARLDVFDRIEHCKQKHILKSPNAIHIFQKIKY